MVFQTFAEASYWFKRRDIEMQAAREALEFWTTDQVSPAWDFQHSGRTVHFDEVITRRALPADHETVKRVVGGLVKRARHAHNVAMGRTPAIERFVYATDEGVLEGGLYAQPEQKRHYVNHRNCPTNPATLSALAVDLSKGAEA